MILKIISCFAITLVSVYGNQVKEKSAISKQGFDRSDIPISFKYSNVHNYKHESKPEATEQNGHRKFLSALKNYPVMQYAPLNYDTKTGDHREQHNKIKPHETKNETKSESTVVNTGRHVYTGPEKPKHDHLEPKLLKEEDNENQQNYRSFISGHNVEEYVETTSHFLEKSVDPFVTHPDIHQKQKVKSPKFVYYQKIKENFVANTQKPQNIVEEKPANGPFKFLEFLPADFNSHPRKEHKKSIHYTYSLHDLLAQEKQQQTYAHPRIHLNIARSYNIAKQPQKAHLPPILAQKSLNNLLSNPKNTLMIPVRK